MVYPAHVKLTDTEVSHHSCFISCYCLMCLSFIYLLVLCW